MTSAKKKPKPIRLTKGRALALLDVFETGAAVDREWIIAEIRSATDTGDLERMSAAKAKDATLAAARDAAAIVRHRYLGGEAPTEPNPTLF